MGYQFCADYNFPCYLAMAGANTDLPSGHLQNGGDVKESFQLQMGFSFPFLHVNDLRTFLLIMRTRSLLYVGLCLNLIANAINNNYQHLRSGTNVRMSQNPHRRRKRMGTGKLSLGCEE